MAVNQVNENCYIQIQIKEANFLKDDGDVIGKQDPFVCFVHDGKKFKTETHQNAGKEARFNDVFRLE